MSDPAEADHRLAFEFLELFARFEWALKTSGYLKSREPNDPAKPDWDKFAEELRGRLLESPQVASARDWLNSHPPREQRIDENRRLGWKPVRHKRDDGEERRLLRLIQTARNNLFHGGKYAASTGLIGEPARDGPLLEACIAILKASLELSPVLKDRFRERA